RGVRLEIEGEKTGRRFQFPRDARFGGAHINIPRSRGSGLKPDSAERSGRTDERDGDDDGSTHDDLPESIGECEFMGRNGSTSREPIAPRLSHSGSERLMTEFREASRLLTSVLAPLETRVLLWIATRLPRWINSDHLTALALGAMVAVGL